MKKILSLAMMIAMIAMLSVSVFATGENIAPSATVNAPFCSSWESAASINDGAYPESSGDASGSYVHYGSWGSAQDNYETVSYTWNSEVTVDSVGLFFWFNTANREEWLAGGGIDFPASYTIQYWNGTEYVDVANASGLGIEHDTMNVTTFDAVTTTSIQITMVKLADSEITEDTEFPYFGLGIFEFEVYAAGETAVDGGATEETPIAPQTGFATVILATAAVLSGSYIASKKH